MFLLEVVPVAIATTIGEAGTVFTEWVVIPAWDVFFTVPGVRQFRTVPFVPGEVDTLKLIKTTGVFFTGGLIGAIGAVGGVVTFQEAIDTAAIAAAELSGVAAARAHWVVPFR